MSNTTIKKISISVQNDPVVWMYLSVEFCDANHPGHTHPHRKITVFHLYTTTSDDYRDHPGHRCNIETFGDIDTAMKAMSIRGASITAAEQSSGLAQYNNSTELMVPKELPKM